MRKNFSAVKNKKKPAVLLLILSLLAFSVTSVIAFNTQTFAGTTVNSWWPVENATLSGVQPFKAELSGSSVESYSMYWSVDDGTLTYMPTSYTDGPHKEISVDVSTWNWNPTGTYNISFTAKDNKGKVIGKSSFYVNVLSQAPITSAAQATVTTTPSVSSPSTGTTAPAVSVTPIQSPSKPLAGKKLYVNPSSNAANQAAAWRSSRPADAALMDKIAGQSQAMWFGGWNSAIQSDVNNYVSGAAATGSVPTLVAYNIPQRDCGGWSSGGTSVEGYISWIKGMAAGIGSRSAIVILEPDAISLTSCLSSGDQATRLSLLSQAVTILKGTGTTAVYIDAGHPNWISAATIADRLKGANIAAADGFSLNVSNFMTTNQNIDFGTSVSSLVGNKHFVIDTSRDGNGPTADAQWCNPAGRSLGEAPTTSVSNPLVDAYLWIKAPGESDGNCNGGPSAGTWWPDYALELSRSARY